MFVVKLWKLEKVAYECHVKISGWSRCISPIHYFIVTGVIAEEEHY